MRSLRFFRFMMVFTLLFTSAANVVTPAIARPEPEPAETSPALPVADLVLYADALASGWEDWSWDSTVMFDNAAPTLSGVASIAVTFNTAYAGFSLRTAPALSPADFNAVSFFVYAPDTDRSLSLVVQSSDDGGEGQSFDFNAPADQWSQILVGLDSLGDPAAIARVNIGDRSGAPQPVLYLDQISLISSTGWADADIPAVIPGAPKPTISIDQSHGYAGQAVDVSGVAPAGFSGVRLAWLFDGATFNAGETATDIGGAYSAELEVPTGAPEGLAKICAAVTGTAQAIYSCADFTVDPPAPGGINGLVDASLINPGQAAELQLLNQAGDALYKVLLTPAGTFTLPDIAPGLYEAILVGNLNLPAASEMVLIQSAADIHVSIGAILAGGEVDPVTDRICDPRKSKANVSTLGALYTDRGLSISGGGLGASTQATDSFGRAYAMGHFNSILKTLIRKDFGTYLSGVPLQNTFTAGLQNISGVVEGVMFHIKLPGGELLELGFVDQAPYQISYNVGKLPPGKYSLIAAAVVNGGRQCPRIREISVAANPMSSSHYQLGAYANWDAAAEVYRFGGILPNVGGLLPQRANVTLPLIGTLESKLEAGLALTGVLHMDGVIELQAVTASANAKLLGIPILNETQSINPPRDGRFYAGADLRNFDNLEVPLGRRSLWQDHYEVTVFNSVLFSFFGIISVGARIKVGVSGELIMDAILYPMRPDLSMVMMPVVGAYLSAGLWVNVLILASAGMDAIPTVHLGLPLNIVTWETPVAYLDDPCIGFRVDVKAWVEVDYFLDEWREEATFNWFKVDEPDGCLYTNQILAQLEQQARANAAIAPPTPRVMASPQVTASFSGRVISVYVEDITPQAEHPSSAVMARFKDLDTGDWLPAVQVSDGLHAVNDPAATFFGFDGDEVMVAWTQTDMTQAEEEAADSLDDYLNQLEIYINVWDGQTWSGPFAVTGDLLGDGFPVLAGDEDGVTLAWVRDIDGDSTTTADMVIALSDWSWETGMGEFHTLAAAPTGLNAQVSIARMNDDGIMQTALAWTYDADGSLETLEDRRLHMAVRGQSADPTEWVQLNPQPLPPRAELPSLTFDQGSSYLLRLAFIVHNLEGDGQSAAGVSDNSSIWTAQVDLRNQTPQVTGQALLDESGAEVPGERPRLQTDDVGETVLVFRRFGELGERGQLGQVAMSQFISNDGADNFSPPVYLTGDLNQNWQAAAAINPENGLLEVLSVQRPLLNPVALQALGIAGDDPIDGGAPLFPAAMRAAAAQVALLSSLAPVALAVPASATTLTGTANDDLLMALEYGTDGDPSLDPLLEISQPHASIGSSVTVTATVRNLGRTDVSGVVRFYTGLPGSGTLLTEVTVPGALPVGEVRVVAADYTVQGSEDPIYAEVVIDPPYTDASGTNNTATVSLGALPAPQIASVQPSQVFEAGLEIVILPSEAQAVSGYRVLRSQTPGGPYELVGETTGDVHYDIGLGLDQTYCYVVHAYDRSGLISPNSQEVCNLVPSPAGNTMYLPLIVVH